MFTVQTPEVNAFLGEGVILEVPQTRTEYHSRTSKILVLSTAIYTYIVRGRAGVLALVMSRVQ